MVGHLMTANFASKNLLDLFKIFFILRPLCLFFYSGYITILAIHKAKFSWNKLRAAKRIEIEKDELIEANKALDLKRGVSDVGDMDKSNMDFVHALVYDDFELDMQKTQKRDPDEEIEFEHPEIPSTYESFMTFLLMPIVIYGGFGRSVVVSEKRSNILMVSHA